MKEISDTATIMVFVIIIMTITFIDMGFIYYELNNKIQSQQTDYRKMYEHSTKLTNSNNLLVKQLEETKASNLKLLDEIYNIKQAIWLYKGILNDINQDRINTWIKKNHLQNFDWFSVLNCSYGWKPYESVIRRIYDDMIIVNIEDYNSTTEYSVFYYKNKKVECFDYGMTINCTDILCFEKPRLKSSLNVTDYSKYIKVI